MAGLALPCCPSPSPAWLWAAGQLLFGDLPAGLCACGPLSGRLDFSALSVAWISSDFEARGSRAQVTYVCDCDSERPLHPLLWRGWPWLWAQTLSRGEALLPTLTSGEGTGPEERRQGRAASRWLEGRPCGGCRALLLFRAAAWPSPYAPRRPWGPLEHTLPCCWRRGWGEGAGGPGRGPCGSSLAASIRVRGPVAPDGKLCSALEAEPREWS